MSMWAGQGAALSRKTNAKELVDTLILEAYETIKSISTKL